MLSGVYTITHTASGRRYVGSAINIEKKRWKEHRRQLARGVHHSRFLQRSWARHGEGAFVFRVALWCDRENVLMYEQALIDLYRPAFNTNPTAGSMLGFKMRAESRAKLSVAAKRTRNFTGHRHSEESKRRISLAKQGVKQDPAVVERRKAAIRALPIPPSGTRVFNADEIRQLRTRMAGGVRGQVLVREFGVSSSVISEIKTRKTYRWVA